MNNASLTPSEQDQVRAALAYWRDHWDFECSTLFGIELEELIAVLSRWPKAGALSKETEALAVIGSLRELLYGASTPRRERLPSILGIEYEAATALCTKVHGLYRAV
jgi:hypothetical protein